MFAHVVFHVTRERLPHLGKNITQRCTVKTKSGSYEDDTSVKWTINRALKFHSCTYVVCVYSEDTSKCAWSDLQVILAKERDYLKPAVSARRQIEARCASCWTTAQHQRHSVARALQPELYLSCLHSPQSESARRHARMHSQTIRQASARAKHTKLRNTKNKHMWKHNNQRIR